MGRKQAAESPIPSGIPDGYVLSTRRGRPPNEPRTELGKWIQSHGITTVDFALRLKEIAPLVGLQETDAPQPKTLLDAVNGRHWPHAKVILLVRHATGGDVDVEHWVRDLS